MKLQLYYPTKPPVINQGFGSNPDYYAKFLDTAGNPLKGHNGVDFAAAHGTPVYAVCNGQAMYNIDEHGGDGIVLNTTIAFDYKGAIVPFNIILWHLCPKNDPNFPIQIPDDMNWHPVVAGQLLGYADNTGAPFESSGDHLHFGLVPLDQQWNVLEPNNGYGGCIDPTPYFNSICIEDYLIEKLANEGEYVAEQVVDSNEIEMFQKVSFLQRIRDALLSLWKGR